MQSAGKSEPLSCWLRMTNLCKTWHSRFWKERDSVLCDARNAAEALEAYRHQEEGIDLLLSDVVMPGKTGPELGTELRKHQPELKVVFMSGYGDSCPEASMPDAKEVYYLAKPFSVKTLVDKINEAFGQSTGRLAVGAG